MQNFTVAEGMILSEIVRFTLLENILFEYIDLMLIFNVLYDLKKNSTGTHKNVEFEDQKDKNILFDVVITSC